MEITFTEKKAYSLELDKKTQRELADFLDIDTRRLRKLVEDAELELEFPTRFGEWMELNRAKAECIEVEPIEVDQINW